MTEKPNWDLLAQKLLDDAEFDELLSVGLEPVSPPDDFTERVMAAIAAEEAPAAKPKLIRFPFRRFAAGLGTCAAALALFFGISSATDNAGPSGILSDKPLQLAMNPTVTPQAAEDSLPAPAAAQTPAGDLALPAASTAEPAPADSPNAAPEEQAVTPPQVMDGEFILPRTAYGTETGAAISARMLASVEGTRLYLPGFAGKNAVFYTEDDSYVYSWRVDLASPSEPQVSMIAAKSDLADASVMLQHNAAPIESTSLITSPDKAMLAQNSVDGIWISLLEGDVFRLTEEGNGKLLLWSPDSSKLVFTNDEGALFVGYPLERRIYQLAAGTVTDACWSDDGKTLLYITNDGRQDALYIVSVY